jgi:RimJ/RimL family protein N-acetyltransferase
VTIFAKELAAERHRTLLAEAEVERTARALRRSTDTTGVPRAGGTGAWRSGVFAAQRLRSGLLTAWLTARQAPTADTAIADAAIADAVEGGSVRWPCIQAIDPVMLPDGSAVVIRPVEPTDAPLLVDGFARMSPQSRRWRFLAVKNHLSDADLRLLTDLDHHDREALGALDTATGQGVGVARYARLAGDSQAADVAVTVVDSWQRRGVATALLARLSVRAREAGIHSFTAQVSADNEPMIELLRTHKAGVELTQLDGDVAEYHIALTPFVSSRPIRASLARGLAPCA